MSRLSPRSRGVSLLVVMVVIVLLTLLVAGALVFTGREHSAAVVQARGAKLTACIQAAKNMFLSRVQSLSTVGSTVIPADTALGNMLVASRHYDSVAIEKAEPVALSSFGTAQSSVTDLSNFSGTPQRGAKAYRVVATCTDHVGGPEHEVEFVVQMGF